MYYVVRNDKDTICRIFNNQSNAKSYITKNKQWVLCTKLGGVKKHTDAIAFIKREYPTYLILGNNGAALYTPKVYSSSVDKMCDVLKKKEESVEKPVISAVTNTAITSLNTNTKVKKSVEQGIISNTTVDGVAQTQEGLNSVVKSESEIVSEVTMVKETTAVVEKETKVCSTELDVQSCTTLDTVFDESRFKFEENYLNVLHSLRDVNYLKVGNQLNCSVKQSIVNTELCVENSEAGGAANGLVDVLDNLDATIHNLPLCVTDINKQLITMLLHLDIFELQRVFSDFSIALACVDGSFKEGVMSYAYVMISGGKVVEDSDICVTEGKVIRKIEGTSTQAEFMSVRQAIAKAVALGVKDLIICYDCESVISTISGVALRTEEQKKFKTFVDTMGTMINLHFVKVKAHSGVPLHTRVDVLAGIQVGRTI